MIRTIQTGTENPILRQTSTPIEEINRDVRKLARDMKSTIGPAHGMGLAAPQVGVNVRMILINVPSEYYAETGCDLVDQYQHLILINPEITSHSEYQCVFEEGCLSLPDFYGDVSRPCSVIFRAKLLSGEEVESKAGGIFARILQHEIDHLDGVLFDDYVKEKKKKELHKIYI